METNSSKPKLLLADDSVTIRKVVEMTFAGEGIDVWTASDGESAMMKFVEIQPDIVLVDVGLPGTSGYEICDMIKRDETTEHIPVLLLVGSFEPFDPEDAKRVNANGFLTKPFQSLRELVACVRDFMADKSPSVTTPTPETEDIEDLYRDSFSRITEVEDFTTVDDYLTDKALDDQMIETFSIGDAAVSNGGETTANVHEAAAGKEFDWSPASIVTQSVAAEPSKVVTEAEFTLDDDKRNDDMQTGAAGDPISQAVSIQPPPVETDIAGSKSEASTVEEPSPEFVELVAQRVIERLSDRVIREIALESVPQIVEKIMREALDPRKKE